MLLTDICIKRPVFTIVLSLIIMTLGGVFYTKLQIRGTPNISPPIININANYSDADALYMEKQITTRIEKAVKNVKNLKSISSKSSAGSSNISLLFDLDADIEIALNDVRSKISKLSNIFPDDMALPQVEKLDADAQPSLWLSINSDRHDDLELTRISDNEIKSVLEKLPTVGESIIFGARTYTMRIEPINSKLLEHNITPIEIEQVILEQNKDYPAGQIKTEIKDFNLRLNASLNKPGEFANIIVKKYPDGTIVKLGEIAKVVLKSRDNDVILRYNGKRSMAVGLVKQSTANILELSDSVREELKKIRKNLPEGVKIEIAFDTAIPVDSAVNAVFFTIFEAIILVGLVTFIFLASIRITLIPLVTIPVSLIGTFTMMYFLGFSINSFTLLAMILAIGLVVDDAIVMMENIFRHHDENGLPAMEAAFAGSREVGFAVIAMTLTLASVFLPIGFIEGFLGKLFIEFAWTLAFYVLFSGFVALTLTPMMASRMIKAHSEAKPVFLQKFDEYLKLLQTKYINALEITLNNKGKFFAGCGLSIVILVLSFMYVSKSFIPDEDQGYLMVIFDGPEGSSVKESEKTIIQAEQIFASHKDIKGFFQVIGWGGGEKGFAFISLKNWNKRDKLQDQIKDELNQKLFALPGMSIFAISPRSLGGPGSDKLIEFNLVTSLEYQQIDEISKEFVRRMEQNPIFEGIERDFKSSTPTLDIVINKEKAYRYGVNLDTIGRTIQYLIAGKKVGDFRMGNDIYDVILRYNEKERQQIADLSKISIRNENLEMLPLETVADIIEKITVKEYEHYNNSRSINISADKNNDYDLAEAVKVIEQIAGELLDSNNTKIAYLGEIERMQESDTGSLITFLFALIFIYLVLSAQFESFLDSALILMAVPFSITGGVLALLLFGNSVNMYSNIGLVTLIGLVAKNSIMIVEFTNQLREQGLKIRESLIKAASLRLRPILMTSIATICGAVPLVIASGAGAASRNSIGLVIVGGMLVGTIFTIFVIPVLYQLLKKEDKLAAR
ncbi:MAG: efflux RND transporter permease subunit [Rickettsiaceae bacterium]|nr:efflux RND transporter permease subunit [Rickettsiaceae bacterium]